MADKTDKHTLARAGAGMPSAIQVLDDNWRDSLIAFLKGLGVPFRIRPETLDQPAPEEGLRLVPGGSYWQDGTLHLQPWPDTGPIEWFYFAAHYGIARTDERQKFDFGWPLRTPADRALREQKARRVTIGWCSQSGMDPESLSQQLWDWGMTPMTSETCKMPGEARWNMRHHYRQCKDATERCIKDLDDWGIPAAPIIWSTKFFSFSANKEVR